MKVQLMFIADRLNIFLKIKIFFVSSFVIGVISIALYFWNVNYSWKFCMDTLKFTTDSEFHNSAHRKYLSVAGDKYINIYNMSKQKYNNKRTPVNIYSVPRNYEKLTDNDGNELYKISAPWKYRKSFLLEFERDASVLLVIGKDSTESNFIVMNSCANVVYSYY